MQYREALIAWNPGTDQIRVGRLLRRNELDWTESPIHYAFTGGAAETFIRDCTDEFQRDMLLFIEFNTIVVRDRVQVEVAHREFLKIDEYRCRISPDSPGLSKNDDDPEIYL